MAVVLQLQHDVARWTTPDGKSYTGDQTFVLSDESFAQVDPQLIGSQLIIIGVGADPDTSVIVDGLVIVQEGASVGPQGFQGNLGIQGYQGSQGVIGTQGRQGSQGVQGDLGNQGPQGFLGNIGPQGNQGGPGTNGLQGNTVLTGNGQPVNSVGGVTDVYFDKNGRKLYGPKLVSGWNLSGGVDLTGPQGTQGNPSVVQGPIGLQGSQGFVGPQGSVGSQGYDGFQGSQGNKGDLGFQGSQGTQGVQGFQGPGNQGPQGDTGTRGPQGTQGLQGIQGNPSVIQGPQGFQGSSIQGFQGRQGFQGSTGTQGGSGPQGSQGVTGTVGYQGSQGNSGFQGIQGPIGLQGYQGSQGQQGQQGFQGIPVTVNNLNGPSISLYLSDLLINPIPVALGTSGPVNLDTRQGYAIATLTANATSSTFINLPVPSGLVAITWVQDAVGGRTYVWPTICKFAGGVAPSDTTLNSRTTVLFLYDGSVAFELSRAVGVR